MHIIPVIDLRAGLVVHARRGERATYRAIQSPLSRSAAPLAVVEGLLAYAAFDALYIADLDAISGVGHHRETVREIAQAHPRLSLWLDGGFADYAQCAELAEIATLDFVLATESLASLSAYTDLRRKLSPRRCVLSLDQDAGGRRGLVELFARPARWPSRVLHMNLTRVGATRGPDWDGLAALREIAGKRAIYAAGGVRGDADLEELERRGIAGALVATALHEQRISRSMLP